MVGETDLNLNQSADSTIELVSKLLTSLRDSTSPDNFCQLLALSVLRDYKVESTFIARLDSDACLTMVGSWGYPPERTRIDDRPSIRTPMAITDAIREGEIKVFPTWEAYLETYPHLEHKAGPGNAIVCVPFSSDGTRSGGLGITFTNSIEGLPINRQLLELMVKCCEVVISGTWARSAFGSTAPRTSPLTYSDLTSRQKTIIQLVREGNTNTEIAVKMRFSPSLIKKELQELYRIFHISDRKRLASIAPIATDQK
ncbi:MAG: hypothetical protein RL101_407 [Actinomycetota bacterium]